MHCHVEVWIPEDVNITDPNAVENAVDETLRSERGTFDWHQVGGRFTGLKSGGAYDPETDPANREPCSLCDATGCNGCDGTGIRLKWPTQWAFYAGDVTPATEDFVWTEENVYGGPLDIVDGYFVTVDCHS